MGQRDVELVRLSRTDGRLRLGVAAVVLLLIAAVAKPWPDRGSTGAAGTGQPLESSVGLPAAAPGSPSSPAAAAGLCASPDGWRVVADDVELGRSVRTWMVADVEYSTITPPALSTIPVTTLVSSQVERLAILPARRRWHAGRQRLERHSLADGRHGCRSDTRAEGRHPGSCAGFSRSACASGRRGCGHMGARVLLPAGGLRRLEPGGLAGAAHPAGPELTVPKQAWP